MPIINRIIDEAAYYPRCSSDKTAALVRPRQYAIKKPYMQVNRPGMVSWLVFDLDHSNPHIWEDNLLPTPNCVVINPKNCHSHLYYAISPVCTTTKARQKPINYMKAVYRALAIELEADMAYSSTVAKTPHHPWWNTWEIHDKVYDLDTLADYVELNKPCYKSKIDLDSVSHSRHCTLFEIVRHYAYSIVNEMRENSTYNSFYDVLLNYAEDKNQFTTTNGSNNSLTFSQVKATVKSIANWTWSRYRGSRRSNLGVMQLSPALPLENRQRLSSRRTHSIRRNKTEQKIKEALKGIKVRGEKVTQKALSAITGLTRQTIAKYKHLLTENNLEKVECVNIKPDVNFGMHQITGACSRKGKRLVNSQSDNRKSPRSGVYRRLSAHAKDFNDILQKESGRKSFETVELKALITVLSTYRFDYDVLEYAISVVIEKKSYPKYKHLSLNAWKSYLHKTCVKFSLNLSEN